MNSIEVLEELLSPGSWFMFPQRFLQVMTADEAVLLSFLISHSRRNKKGNVDQWFYCKYKTIESKICFNKRKQSRLLSSMSKKRILKFERRGIPSRRWICLDVERVWKMTRPTDGDKTAPLEWAGSNS